MTQVLTDANQKVVWKRLAYNLNFNLNQGLSDPDHDGIRVENNFGFPGQYYDAGTDLYYNWHRYYDPRTGRYTRPDPIGLNGSLNPYRYAGNNPVMFSDPTGLAYFAKRPLAGVNHWFAKNLGSSKVDDFLNTELIHEQIFFEDNLPYPALPNVGFHGKNGAWNKLGIVAADDPKFYNDYWRSNPVTYDDTLLRKAVANIGGGNYRLIGSNCQTWADKVREEYKHLKIQVWEDKIRKEYQYLKNN